MERIMLVSLDLEVTGEQVMMRARGAQHAAGTGNMTYRPFGNEKEVMYLPNSIVSAGACIIANINGTWEVIPRMFYRELKPISSACTIEAMRIACLGLECRLAEDFLAPGDNPATFDPHSPHFHPELFLERMRTTSSTLAPEIAIPEFEDYIENASVDYGLPVLAASPIVFDGKFMDLYFALFGTDRYHRHPLSKSPLGYGGIDIGSVLRGKANDMNVHLSWLGLRAKDGLTHNSLEDAIQQAEEFVVIANPDPRTLNSMLRSNTY